MRVITEEEFSKRIREALTGINVGCVTGPGRSGAIASVYASHILGVPFIPFGNMFPEELGTVLIIDTAKQSGRTLRKAASKYTKRDKILLALYEEPPRVIFWYERDKT